MLNWRPEDPDLYEDVQTRWNYENTWLNRPAQKRLERLWRSSRDSARTPVQWDSTEHAGFTTGTPWFSVNENYKDINVAQQEADPDSILHFYRKAISLRKKLKVVRYGTYKEHFPLDPHLYIYSRRIKGCKLLIVCSFSHQERPLKLPKGFDLKDARLILKNYDRPDPFTLQPYESRVYLWKD